MKLEDVLEILGVADAELVLGGGRGAGGSRSARGAADGAVAVGVGARLHAVHARPLRPPAPPVRGPDARPRAGLLLGHRRADRPAGGPGRPRISQGEILRAIDFLAAAIAAVKDGSEPRIQLEMALLKATQPQADLSLQALMFRIDQLEAAAGEWRPRKPAARPAPAATTCTEGVRGGRRSSPSRGAAADRAAAGRVDRARADRFAVARRRRRCRRGERDARRRAFRSHTTPPSMPTVSRSPSQPTPPSSRRRQSKGATSSQTRCAG